MLERRGAPGDCTYIRTYICVSVDHKVLKYVEYRAVSGVFQNIDPPTSPPSECVLHPHQRLGDIHSPGGEGGGVNILEDARHRIDLLLYNLSTVWIHRTAFTLCKLQFNSGFIKTSHTLKGV